MSTATRARPVDHEEWRIRGACASGRFDPNLWTSTDPGDQGQARFVCMTACPVLERCYQEATRNPHLADQAVYGGMYWCRPRGSNGERLASAPVHEATRQPVPVPPTGQPARTDRDIRAKQPSKSWLVPYADHVRRQWEAGVRVGDIAAQFGVREETVYRFVAASGWERPRQPCGTLAAYERHRRAGERSCDLCREAKRLDAQRRAAAA